MGGVRGELRKVEVPKKCVSRKSITYVDFFQLFASRCYNLTPIAGPLRLEWGDLTESERVITGLKR